MPKIEYNFESEEKIPAEFKPFAVGTKVTLWSNKDDLELAKEVNPLLADKNTELIGEKRNLQVKYDALKTASSDDALDTAKLIVDNEKLKQSAKSSEETELLTAIQNVFSGVPLSEVKTKIPALVEDSKFAAKARKEKELEAVYEVSGFKNKKVFLDLVTNPDKMKNIEGNLIIEQIENSDKKALFANVKDANGVVQKKAFADYVNSSDDWKDYLPSLTNGDVKENQTWIPQNPTLDGQTTNDKKTAADKAIEKHNEAQKKMPSPFAPISQAQPANQ